MTNHAQIFSVYDYKTREYRYFAAPLGDVPASGHYRPPTSTLAEGLLTRLPRGAHPIGEGTLPQGVIATEAPGGTGQSTFSVAKAFVGGLAVFGIWWWFKKRKKL